MPDNVKVIITERNGVDILNEELALTTENIPFTHPDYNSDDAYNAIVESRDTATAFAEYESFFSLAEESTASNDWVTKSSFPYTTSIKTAGTYVLDYTALIGQSNKQKTVGFQVQYRLGTSGTWLEIVDIRDALSAPDAFQLRTGFTEVVVPTEGVFQVRVRWGQTDDGGTGKIKQVGIKIGRQAT